MRLLILAVCLAVTSALDCPEQCDCVTGDDLEYFCTVGPDKVTFNARNYEYVIIKCEGTNFTCADLPVINFGNDLPLSSIATKGCSPAILPCLNKALNTPSVSFLSVNDGVAPLEGQHVAGLGDVKELMIVRGPDTSIPISVITSLPSLRSLRITGTRVTVESNDFINATQLKFLELSDGQISRIPEDAFNGLSNLLNLNIWGNNISEIGVNSLRGLDSLQSLALTTSHISHIAAGSLAHVPNLQSIVLFKNQLKELPAGLFYNLTQLENITIQSNDVPLRLHTHTFANLPSLKKLIIENSGSNMPSELLTGCDALLTMKLSGNNITSLPQNIFKDLKNLEILDLSRNKISTLNSGVFAPLKQLKSLNLNRNYLEVLDDFLFSGLRNLNDVFIDHNQLSHISSLAFQGAAGLKTISLKSNKLTFKSKHQVADEYINIEEYSPFSTLVELKNLYLNGNEIYTMFADWRNVLTRLTILNLTENNFTELDEIDCQFLSDNIIVDLRRNNISTLRLDDAVVSKGDPLYRTSKNSILLDENPFVCDCQLYQLAMRMKGFKPFSSEPTLDVNGAKCASPPHLQGNLFTSVSPDDLNCDLGPEYCFNTCSSCEKRPAKNDLAYDCYSLPETIPDPANFRAKTLSIRLRTAPKHIDNLQLQLLNLSNIGLHDIPFSPSKSVKAIDLSNNKLTMVPMKFLESNTTLYLANNPFKCDCWNSEDLATLKASQIVADLSFIRCGDKDLSSMDPLALCNSWRAAAVASGAFMLLVFIVAIIVTIVYRNSHEILAFIIVKGLCPCCFVEDPDDKEYDVFVSYAHKDRMHLEKLMPKLENEFGLKTCVHYRDWSVGDFIPDQINRSVEKSRKTIILLSNNFLNSAYANMEFRAAHNLALKEGKNRIILILLEDVMSHEKLSDELKAHMKMNTFLKWDDARFAERLQRALPLRNNKKFVWPDVFKQAGEKTVKSGLDVHLNSDGQLVNVAMKDTV